MPNPTTNKAGIGELIATIGTIGEHMLCMLPLDTLAARDLVGNVAALAYTGVNGTQTGYSPTLVDDINGPAGVTAPYYRFGPSDRALLFKGRGFPSITYPMTLAITFKLNVDVTASGTIPIFAANSEVSLFAWGLSIQLNGSTIQLGLSRSLAGSGFHSAGASGLLTNGHWYSVSLTLVSASGAGSRVWNLYDHDTQTQTTQWSTSDTAAPSATAGYLDAVLNPGVVSSAAFASSFCGDVYAACLHTETWDSGTTAWFAGWFADPTACAKGAAYAPDAGTFTAGAANTLGSTATVIRLHAAHPIHGGSGGTLSYQWQRCATADFSTSITDISGATSLLLEDTTAAQDTVYFYRCKQTHSTVPTIVYTNVLAGKLAKGILRVGIVGDSHGASLAPYYMARAAISLGWRVSMCNRSVGGSGIWGGTVGSSWQPSADRVGTTLLDQALVMFDKYSIDYILLYAGVNDSGLSTTDYTTDIGNINSWCITRKTGTKYKMLLRPPVYVFASGYDPAKLQAFGTINQSLANGTTIFCAKGYGYDFFAASRGELSLTDSLHPVNPQGYQSIGFLDFMAILDGVLDPLPTGAECWADATSPVRTLTA